MQHLVPCRLVGLGGQIEFLERDNRVGVVGKVGAAAPSLPDRTVSRAALARVVHVHGRAARVDVEAVHLRQKVVGAVRRVLVPIFQLVYGVKHADVERVFLVRENEFVHQLVHLVALAIGVSLSREGDHLEAPLALVQGQPHALAGVVHAMGELGLGNLPVHVQDLAPTALASQPFPARREA